MPVKTYNMAPEFAARARLNALRELMRMELPDRITDVTDDPAVLTGIPATTLAYRRRVAQVGSWSPQQQQAECLYMIIASLQDGTRNGLDFFRDNEIAFRFYRAMGGAERARGEDRFCGVPLERIGFVWD